MIPAFFGGQPFHGPQVLHGLGCHCHADGFQGRAVRAWIHLEGVARGHPAVGVRGAVRIDGIIRQVGIVEIEAPLQEALDAELEQLHPQYPVAPGREGDEHIGHLFHLAAAVIRPQPRHSVLQKGADAVVGRNGMGHQALFIERVIAQGVDHGAARQQPFHLLPGGGVGVQMLQVGLV